MLYNITAQAGHFQVKARVTGSLRAQNFQPDSGALSLKINRQARVIEYTREKFNVTDRNRTHKQRKSYLS